MQGNPKPKKKPIENPSAFAEGSVPMTNAGNYGARIGTDNGNKMIRLEHKFYSDKRKRKMDPELYIL